MAKKQFDTPELNLQAELPQVVSRDFNLFYKPEAEPEIAGLKNFTQSLDNFINGALTTGNILGETKLKEQSEAEATQFFNMEVENKKAFNSAVNNNEIPREANPYFVDKLKELELGAKVQDFKRKFKERYAKENLSENTDPNAFNFIYEQELKQFLKDNNIGLYEPVELEKNFFSKTSQFREAEENMHMNNQLSKIREQFDKNYKIGIQDLFNPDADIETIGKAITDFIKDKTDDNIMSKTRARELFMESLKEYVEATGDIDFASTLVTQLPNYVKLGTDVLGNVNSLKDDFSALEEALIDRETQEELDKLTLQDIQIKKEDNAVTELTNKYSTFQELKDSSDFALNSRQLEKAKKIYNDRRIGFGQENEPDVIDELNILLEEGDYEEAEKYLDNNRTNLTQNKWFEYEGKIKSFALVKEDSFVGNDLWDNVTGDLDSLINSVNENSISGYPLISIPILPQFKEDLLYWLSGNPLENFKNLSERREAFREFSTKVLGIYKNQIKEEYLPEDTRFISKDRITNPEEKIVITENEIEEVEK